ncbi:Prefoldin subunit-domain-containing protein [Jimgerdemannia flammicorona]|uniref:Prefoldin subunit-domain-containing protein n=1 Tax=Jimgerdemannia flammicorona TaxID=994334 RepID=A0A433BHP9_9FUNG|nr:Prefoldin subunit-domain-containing protein [Jimgerdemannia flammicorona]
MEINMLQHKKILEEKIPKIKKTLSIVKFLISRRESKSDKPIITKFKLNDTLYAKVKVENTGTIFLWLGANIMLKYTLEEARELLASKLAAALRLLTNAEEDLEFLRDQITTMEVSILLKRRKYKRDWLSGDEEQTACGC